MSKYPAVQIHGTSIPSSNAKLRITQLPYGVHTAISLADALQLPGHEFDPKVGRLDIHPYWNRTNPGCLVDDFVANGLTLQVNVLGGVIVDPIIIVALLNASPMEYHHLGGTALEPAFVEQGGEEQDPQKETQQSKYNVDNLTQNAVEAERRWTYVTSFKTQASAGVVQIPVNTLTLGKFFYRHARRYTMWRGTPKFKIMITNGYGVNSNVHFVHSNVEVPAGTLEVNPEDFLENIGYAVTGAPGTATVVDAKWRTMSAFITVSDDPATPDLGYIYIVMPLNSWSDVANPTYSSSTTQFTLYVDPTDIEMKVEAGPLHVGNWQKPSVVVYDRIATPILEAELITSLR
jgi:hypothetical protein